MTGRRPTFFRRCLDEPYRIFFALATLLGLSGVSLWPLYFSGLHKFYPGAMHARLMIEGFLTGFVLGFLGTALPRLLSVPSLRRGELGTLLLLYLLTAGWHIGEQPRAGDMTFIALLLFFGICLARRWPQATVLPPPGFALAALGYCCGLLGPILWLAGLQGWVTGPVAMFGALLLQQAFVLLLLLGIGTSLLPRIFGDTNEEVFHCRWGLRTAFSALVGLVLLATYGFEAHDPTTRVTAGLRGAVALVYLATMLPGRSWSLPRTTPPWAPSVGLLALIVGLLFPLVWPGQRLAGLHVVFLGGFSLMTFAVAARVVLGPTGHDTLRQTRLPGLPVITVLLLMATILRVVGDFLPARSRWLSDASYLWMLAAAIWAWRVLLTDRTRRVSPAL